MQIYKIIHSIGFVVQCYYTVGFVCIVLLYRISKIQQYRPFFV